MYRGEGDDRTKTMVENGHGRVVLWEEKANHQVAYNEKEITTLLYRTEMR